jgi:hypothetical protein
LESCANTFGCGLLRFPLASTAADGTHTNMFSSGGQMWVEYAAPCAPKPKPIIKAPVVSVPVASTSCDPAAVQALANGIKNQITNGMGPGETGLVFVDVIDCKVSAAQCKAYSMQDYHAGRIVSCNK